MGLFDFLKKISPEKLIRTAEKGDAAPVAKLTAKGADPNAADKDNGWTALMKASKNGHTETAQLPIAKGADVNAVGKNGMTALMVASVKGFIETAELLKAKGARR